LIGLEELGMKMHNEDSVVVDVDNCPDVVLLSLNPMSLPLRLLPQENKV
jgi:hypothetical protein